MRNILVLGGSGAIGGAICERLGKDAMVYSASSNDVDLSNPESVQEFIESTRHVNFDTVIHSAGLNVVGNFEYSEQSDIKKSVEANLLGFLPIVDHCIPYWQKTGIGRLVIISSLYSQFARRGRLPYVISKHGLLGVVKTLSIEFAPWCLVNAVAPGYIDTSMTRKNNPPNIIEEIESNIPMGKLGNPDQVARAVEFLASGDNTYITGQEIIVDGGYSAGGFQ
jgi:3-oxoacyl-[acyl-carrier protein] reductase